MKTPAELTELFRARGLKVTPQRQAIFHVLHGDTGHPTAEAVYDAVNLGGGIKAWVAEGLPIVTDDGSPGVDA